MVAVIAAENKESAMRRRMAGSLFAADTDDPRAGRTGQRQFAAAAGR